MTIKYAEDWDMRLQSTSWVVGTLVVLAISSMTLARPKNTTSEFLEEAIENAMGAADIVALLEQTVGTGAAGPHPAVAHPLRQGLYVTALPQDSKIILRFEIDRSDPVQRETLAEVAFSAALGRTFFEFVKAALGSAEAIFAVDQVAQPWKLELYAESPSGGQSPSQSRATPRPTSRWRGRLPVPHGLSTALRCRPPSAPPRPAGPT
jgi:hypothetical protein